MTYLPPGFEWRKYTWANADIVALGAVASGNVPITGATLAAGEYLVGYVVRPLTFAPTAGALTALQLTLGTTLDSVPANDILLSAVRGDDAASYNQTQYVHAALVNAVAPTLWPAIAARSIALGVNPLGDTCDNITNSTGEVWLAVAKLPS